VNSSRWLNHFLLLAVTLTIAACSGFDDGGAWTNGEGDAVAEGALRLSPGTNEHCDWGSAAFLSIGLQEPLISIDASWFDQYVRDPQGLFADRLMAAFDPDASLPGDAIFTGYSTSTVRLWLADSTTSAAFLELSDGTFEAWPRVSGDTPILCA
jgi:hypothetical protein